MKRLIIAAAVVLAALTSATPAMASRPNPDGSKHFCVKISPKPWPWGTWYCR
jgi:hypothetical protein